MAMRSAAQRSVAALVVVGMLASVVLAAGVSLFASSAPDGLERVAEDTGLADRAQESVTGGSPLADYGLTGTEGSIGTAFAGIIGIGIMAAVAFGIFVWLDQSKRKRQPDQ